MHTDAVPAGDRPQNAPFRYCLNTSTVRGHALSLPQEIEIAAKAGYRAMEIWIDELDRYVQSGGTLRDLAARLQDAGITVESAIGFPEWIVEDDARRARGLEEARRNMDMLAQIGCARIAAPAAGATDRALTDISRLASRYRALLEIGERMGVTPMVEVWGFSQTLRTLADAAAVAIAADHPQACVLADVYHLYKGGSGFHGLSLLNGAMMPLFHVNDYPAEPGPATITDAHRVYPGDGVAPLQQIFSTLYRCGFRGALSLELFNPEYYKQDPLQVARTGLEKTRAAAEAAIKPR
ncbi:MAG: sugar phosphate isomerase/epimerase [Chthonomonadaceae bacterium]|nr:sugar phosphate isomerase/epimerase [Chthonomonadaceae bacterium]